MPFQEEIDPLAPQREAAMFYGLFLRGHSADALRRDIDVPKKLLDKLMRRHRNELAVQARLQRVYTFRKQVLAIFDELVTRERATGPHLAYTNRQTVRRRPLANRSTFEALRASILCVRSSKINLWTVNAAKVASETPAAASVAFL